MEWQSSRKEVIGEIMKTDILCEIAHTPEEASLASVSLEEAFMIFRDFEKRYSRFIQGNELWQLNCQEEGIVSEELFDILVQAKKYHAVTAGVFDPSILPVLEASGYAGAYPDHATARKSNFSEVALDVSTRTVRKPAGLMIDLGGIGKGYVIDKAARFLEERFDNFLVDAGGDIVVRGENKAEDYPYWAIDIEHPVKQADASAALLLLKDRAVATSGRNRRHWVHEGKTAHHIIDPSTNESASDELLSVTVIAENATEADVLAKTLFIGGKDKGSEMAERLKIPAVFIDKDGIVTRNHYIEPYVWKL